jgi:hypothetical protein
MDAKFDLTIMQNPDKKDIFALRDTTQEDGREVEAGT